MELYKQLANNLGISEPINGSWIQAIANHYGGELENNNWIQSWAKSIGVNELSGNWIRSIANHYGISDDSQLLSTIINSAGSGPDFDVNLVSFKEHMSSLGYTLSNEEETALNTFIVKCKENNIYSEGWEGYTGDSTQLVLEAFYPFLGLNSTYAAQNLAFPENTNNAKRIIWYGGMTFTTLGAKGNGSNAYGDTHITDDVISHRRDRAIGLYSFTNNTNGFHRDMGQLRFHIETYRSGDIWAEGYTGYQHGAINPNGLGAHTIFRNTSDNFIIAKDNTILRTILDGFEWDKNSAKYLLFAFNNTSNANTLNPSWVSPRELGAAWLFKKRPISNNQIIQFHTDVEELMVGLGRK